MTNPDPFKRALEEYFLLKGKLATGRITDAEFEAALKALMVQDAQGRYWMLGSDTGKWYVHDGAQWIEGLPPGIQAEKPQTLPERRQETPASLPPVAPPRPAARKTNILPIVLLGTLVVVAIAVVAYFAIFLNRGEPSVALQAPTTEPAPLTGATTATATETSTPIPQSTPTLVASSQTPTAALVSSNVPNLRVSVVSSAPPVSVTAKDFAALNTSLAEKIGVLNQAELKFIRDMRASAGNERLPRVAFPLQQKGSALTDQDLKDLAGKAMDVAILADQLGEVSAKQNAGSTQGAPSADAYLAIARNALSLVVDAQTIRQGLLNQILPGADGIALIAQYGAQLWNNEVTDGSGKGNPFSALSKNSEPVQALNAPAAAQVQSQMKGTSPSVWIAQSAAQGVKTVNLPAAQAPVPNPFDPQLQKALTTADAQSDGNKAQQVAGAMLGQLGATKNSTDPSKPAQLQVPTNAVAVAEGGMVNSGNLPSFKAGKATVVSKPDSGDKNPFLQTFGLDGEQEPSDEGKTDVKDAPALVSLSLSNIEINSVNKRAEKNSSFEAEASFSFTVNWTTNLGAPQFTLNCNSSNQQTITQASGSLSLQANGLLILYPGTLTVYCYATSSGGALLGSTSVQILVGDAADATTRAQQVDTDTANLNATLTTEAQGTANAQKTQDAGTAQVVATANAVATEVEGTRAAEFKLTADAFETKKALPPPATAEPTQTPTFTPQIVDQVTHPGNVFGVSTKVVLQRGRLYRFTFSGRVNLINPTKSVSAGDLPEHVNGVTVPASGIVVLEGTGSVANITCGSGESDPNDPGGFGITVEDLGPL